MSTYRRARMLCKLSIVSGLPLPTIYMYIMIKSNLVCQHTMFAAVFKSYEAICFNTNQTLTRSITKVPRPVLYSSKHFFTV